MQILKFQALHILIVAVTAICCCAQYDPLTPDTPANKKGFERHLGFVPPPTVSEIYYYDDEIGIDVLYLLGFRADQQTIDKIIMIQGLEQHDGPVDVSVLEGDGFPWWNQDDVDTLIPYWRQSKDEDYFLFLWYNPETKCAYFLEYSI